MEKKSKSKSSSLKAPMKNIDAYIALQPEEVQRALHKLRRIVKSVVPQAEEVISYGMPAFRYHGILVGFAGWKHHVGFYPWNSRTIDEFKGELKDYRTSKGAIQFPLEKPIPVALIKRIVEARMKENLLKSE